MYSSGTGKSCKGFCWLLLRFPLRNLLRIRQIVKASNSILCLHYYKLCCPTLRWGWFPEVPENLGKKEEDRAIVHRGLKCFLNVKKKRGNSSQDDVCIWDQCCGAITLSWTDAFAVRTLVIIQFFNILTHCAEMNVVKKKISFFVFQLTSWLETY